MKRCFKKKVNCIVQKNRINKICKVVTQKSVAFLYTNNEQAGKKTTNKSIYNSIKKNKYLRIISTKEMKELYIDNYNILLKEIKEDTLR